VIEYDRGQVAAFFDEYGEQERTRFEEVAGSPLLEEPSFMLELVAELTHLARRSPEISQRSGVSVRVSISNLEALLANALKRAVRLGESSAAPLCSSPGSSDACAIVRAGGRWVRRGRSPLLNHAPNSRS